MGTRAAMLFFAAVCAMAGVKSEYLRKEKFAGFQSFTWQACAGLDEDLVLRGVLTDQNIRDAVYPHLAKRGLVEGITTAELTVHCEAHTGVRETGTGPGAKAGNASPSLRVTILLAIRETGSGKPIWRASISDPLSELKDQKNLKRALDRAFRD
jgi:hypothetical protein